ncbi:MAG TPA: hypothetical protein VHQ86_06235 [Candidatus Saccharimonadia bacterium]|jgi:hypothetical protein|nr:hypothetical protein [Candidatus Saccharimonadia bacterium]
MNRILAKVLGVAGGVAAIIGLASGGKLHGILNTDPSLDVIRLVMAFAFLYAGFEATSTKVADIILISTGLFYFLLSLAGIADPRVFGLFPSGLTGLDNGLHLIVGLAATWAGIYRSSNRTAVQQQTHAAGR